MIDHDSRRRRVAQLVRLLPAVLAWATGVGLLVLTILPSFLLWMAITFVLLISLTLLALSFAYAGEGTIPDSALPDAFGVALYGLAFFVVLGYFGARLRALLADQVRRETDALRANTVLPTTRDQRQLQALVDRLCQQVDLAAPTVRIHRTAEPLCYMLPTPDAEGTDLVVSTGLVGRLSSDELAAVLAHELGHRLNRDLTLMYWLLLPVHWSDELRERSTVWVADVLLFRPLAACVSALTIVGVAPFARGREFAADATAARITGAPATLASALERLDDRQERPTRDLRTAYVLNAVPGTRTGWHARLTHPPSDARIDRLQRLAAASDA